MSDTASPRRVRAQSRFRQGFLAQVRSLLPDYAAQLADDDSHETLEVVSADLERLAQTATSLGFEQVSEAATQLSAKLSSGTRADFGPLVRAARSSSISEDLLPVAVVVTQQERRKLPRQYDQYAETLHAFETVDQLRDAFKVSWPVAIVLPMRDAEEAYELKEAYGCIVLTYGDPEDLGARHLAADAGVDGYLEEPLRLSEMFRAVRWQLVRRGTRVRVAVFGDETLASAVCDGLPDAATGLPRLPGQLASVLHQEYPDVVVVAEEDPDALEGMLTVVRSHVTRGYVPIVTMSDDPVAALEAGADDAVATDADPVEVGRRALWRRQRFDDLRRDHNELLGLPNRVGGLEVLHRMVSQARRDGRPLAVGIVLLDGLEDLRAEGEHRVANEAARTLADLMVGQVRREDLVFYLGSDRFAVALPACDFEGADKRLQHIAAAFAKSDPAEAGRLRLAFGVADTDGGIPGLLRRALGKMYAQAST